MSHLERVAAMGMLGAGVGVIVGAGVGAIVGVGAGIIKEATEAIVGEKVEKRVAKIVGEILGTIAAAFLLGAMIVGRGEKAIAIATISLSIQVIPVIFDANEQEVEGILRKAGFWKSVAKGVAKGVVRGGTLGGVVGGFAGAVGTGYLAGCYKRTERFRYTENPRPIDVY